MLKGFMVFAILTGVIAIPTLIVLMTWDVLLPLFYGHQFWFFILLIPVLFIATWHSPKALDKGLDDWF